MARLGIDFGTSNTAAGVRVDGKPRVLTLEGAEQTLPTAVFLDFENRGTLYGREAVSAMIDGREGRFMRALKSILGTSLAREKRQFLNERLSLIEVIARFLSAIRGRAEAQLDVAFDAAVSGRPVRFHGNPERHAQALTDLEAAYELAGFRSVSFLPEPEAAALAAGVEGRCLIVDIGGGTSDFTLCEREGAETKVIVSDGMRLGGTDFDKTLSLAHAMPLLGYEAEIGNELGAGGHRAPRALFHDLASWEKIAFVYDPSLLREVRKWARLAREPRLFDRLGDVLEMHLGHDIAFAVEDGKIAANSGTGGKVDLQVVEKGLHAAFSEDGLGAHLRPSAEKIAACALETVRKGRVAPETIEQVVFVGGSSLLAVVQAYIHDAFPKATFETSEVFTAVVDGLALAAGDTC